ncbi:hypothetical protein Fot_02137 [Forsythia ovata]|uniref:Uncharacterized protein n=1 Tax=Forsythia ovata TaxID=205694 RepID=A0ABD1X5Z4_9LAMI
MSAKVEALQENLANFRDSDEGKQIFEDGKQAGGTGLLELIKDELPDINFDFLYEEGETASLALPLKTDNDEIVAEPTSSTVKPASSEAVVEQTSGTLSSPTVAEPAFSETVLEPTTVPSCGFYYTGRPYRSTLLLLERVNGLVTPGVPRIAVRVGKAYCCEESTICQVKEPSPNSGRPTQDEVPNKGKEKVVEPPPKVKQTSEQVHSSSKGVQLGSSSGRKRPFSDSRSSPTKKL